MTLAERLMPWSDWPPEAVRRRGWGLFLSITTLERPPGAEEEEEVEEEGEEEGG